jgi:hypothetical protein
MKAVSILVALTIMVVVPTYLVYTTVHSIRDEQRRSNIKKVWANFGLSLLLCILFFVTWIGHGIVQWQEYAEDQRTHGEPAEISGYVVRFGESTLENWQSEFLQLFSFVVLAAAFIHRGSAESKDTEDRIEQMVKDIKAKLDA